MSSSRFWKGSTCGSTRSILLRTSACLTQMLLSTSEYCLQHITLSCSITIAIINNNKNGNNSNNSNNDNIHTYIYIYIIYVYLVQYSRVFKLFCNVLQYHAHTHTRSRQTEDCSKVEVLCKKFDHALFAFGSTSKKRRLWRGTKLDTGSQMQRMQHSNLQHVQVYPFKVWSCSTSSGSSLGRQVRELPFTYRFTLTTELLDTPHRRPKRLILGRLFDGGLLDMQESSVLDWVGSVDLVVRMLHPIWSRHQLPALVTGCHWSLHACYLRLV